MKVIVFVLSLHIVYKNIFDKSFHNGGVAIYCESLL